MNTDNEQKREELKALSYQNNVSVDDLNDFIAKHNVQAAVELYEYCKKSDSVDIECEGKTLASTYILSKRDNDSRFHVAPYWHSDKTEFTGELSSAIHYITERAKE